MPAAAARLRLPLWDRSQERLRRRYGWDLAGSDAADRARAAAGAAPDDADAQLLLAAALSMTGDGAGALAAGRRAAELAPDSARAHTTLAAILVQQGDGAGGLHHARRAAELDAGDPHVLYNLGLAEHAAGRSREAAQAFQFAGDALGIDVRPWWRRALGRRRAGGHSS